MTPHITFFLLALAMLCVHEMDALRRHEWRMLPLLSRLHDRTAMPVFVWLHVPLFWLVYYFGFGSVAKGGDGFSLAFAVFCVLHGFVHWFYERHPQCEFRNTLSRSIIWGCAGAGALATLFFPGMENLA